ncbi:glycosyltransferase family 4 protein [Actinoplanes couchii]|uniref:Uncharacterized protein n=1 Tax=Actinoplanes couchii TaxID=403638 RepID=A0ABQ3XNX6_9ACTN|nr:glycosyltransferase family 4 protein [Actinoplanes couchii]MDR6318599.1 glycosyltransferase involved in cell wall biosynthesis [Actinoplanes couchii]GID60208.1 hypothetical protein Aco03nite_086120 [Actinoplanes couchii]
MRIAYLLDGSDNSLYDGKHAMDGRFHTYGQQTYILDLITAFSRRGHSVQVTARGADRLPVLTTLQRLPGVTVGAGPAGGVDLLLVDEAPDEMVAAFGPAIPALKIIHDPKTVVSAYLTDRCSHFVCMTENAVRTQRKRVPSSKCVLVPQGVDLTRFQPADRFGGVPDRPRVLMYCRLDSGRERVLTALIENLDRLATDVRVVGDGPGFWELERRFGDEILLMNHVPNRSVPRLLRDADVVVSLGRGVMEAMASGLPVLCAGYGYAGPVTETNLPELMERNLTGYGHNRDPGLVMADVKQALATPPGVMRALAEQHFCVDTSVDRLIAGRRTTEMGRV